MKLSIGIIGLPNVGKSTLFNALIKKQIADVAPYPFCTIEPNIGIVEVPDERLKRLAEIVCQSQTLKGNSNIKYPHIVSAVVEFYDIAGLVKGASKGEGLGNKFLSHIREVEAALHVVRLFEDNLVAHLGKIREPLNDIQIVQTELMLADLTTLGRQEPPKLKATKEEIYRWKVIEKIRKNLNQGIAVRKQSLSQEELRVTKNLNLLTAKSVLYVFNVAENQLENIEEIEKKIEEIFRSINENSPYLIACVKLENEILLLSKGEQKEYLRQYHLEETGLNRLIKKTYQMLGLISFFTTTGGKEIHAWTIKKGTKAVEAAGVVHSDFAKYFIKADVIPYQEFLACGSWSKARETGKVQTVGKNYQIKDGEVVEFKIGA